jgi:hypothetical protein
MVAVSARSRIRKESILPWIKGDGLDVNQLLKRAIFFHPIEVAFIEQNIFTYVVRGRGDRLAI